MHDCILIFTSIIANNTELKELYLQQMNKNDTKRVSDMHYKQHGIQGMMGSLDCMHVAWKNCPVAWQCSYKGKEGAPTLILEAVADYNLWVWHAAFAYPGTQNDINVWNQSPLLASFIDGTYEQGIDIPFSINDKEFDKVFVLVDGIYPPLSRFVKAIDLPIGIGERKFTSWQESARKDIERAFAVLQIKFNILTRPVQFWHVSDIHNVVMTTIILHNMMVSARIQQNEMDSEHFYEPAESMIDTNTYNNTISLATTRVQEVAALKTIYQQMYGPNLVQRLTNRHVFDNAYDEAIAMRWDELYNTAAHVSLQEAIIAEVVRQ
jgi:hypothetical protein